jgi:hypothetical protein
MMLSFRNKNDFIHLIRMNIQYLLNGDANFESNERFISETTTPLKVAPVDPLTQLSNLNYEDGYLVSLAISLYNQSLPSNFNKNEWNNNNLNNLLFDKYPALKLITETVDFQPISLYSLLQDHTILDLTKCFNWQNLNSIALYKDNITSSIVKNNKNPNAEPSLMNSEKDKRSLNNFEIISFENLDFSQRFAYKDTLDFTFFIKQARPFFAYNYFIRDELKKHSKLHKTLLEEARLRTHLILIDYYDNQKIVSSCLTFSELLNVDTFKMKLTVYLITSLNEYYIKHGLSLQVARKKCSKYSFKFDRIHLKWNV